MGQRASEDVDAHMAFLKHVGKLLEENGEYVDAQALTPTPATVSSCKPTPSGSTAPVRTRVARARVLRSATVALSAAISKALRPWRIAVSHAL